MASRKVKQILISLLFAAGISSLVVMTQPLMVNALPNPTTQFAACGNTPFFGFPPWYDCLEGANQGKPKITQLNDIWLIAFPIVESLIKAGGYIAVGFVLWGGFQFIKSDGDPGKIKQARETIRDAIIGLIICILSVAIVQFVASRFTASVQVSPTVAVEQKRINHEFSN